MATRGGSARRVPAETEPTITYVQCDGLVSLSPKLFLGFFAILESNLKASCQRISLCIRILRLTTTNFAFNNLVFCNFYAPFPVTYLRKLFGTI